MSTHELAQFNIGVIRAPMDSPGTDGFAANHERINVLAEAMPGFVWRDIESLDRYVYGSAHVELMRRRRRLSTERPAC